MIKGGGVELRLELFPELELEFEAELETELESELELPELDLRATSSGSNSGRRFPCRFPS